MAPNEGMALVHGRRLNQSCNNPNWFPRGPKFIPHSSPTGSQSWVHSTTYLPHLPHRLVPPGLALPNVRRVGSFQPGPAPGSTRPRAAATGMPARTATSALRRGFGGGWVGVGGVWGGWALVGSLWVVKMKRWKGDWL